MHIEQGFTRDLQKFTRGLQVGPLTIPEILAVHKGTAHLHQILCIRRLAIRRSCPSQWERFDLIGRRATTLRQSLSDFQAVVTDLSMPQMSGTEFAQEVLQLCPKMPVVLTTGYIRPQDQELARSVGVQELILKPDTIEELGNTLHRIMSQATRSQSASCSS